MREKRRPKVKKCSEPGVLFCCCCYCCGFQFQNTVYDTHFVPSWLFIFIVLLLILIRKKHSNPCISTPMHQFRRETASGVGISFITFLIECTLSLRAEVFPPQSLLMETCFLSAPSASTQFPSLSPYTNPSRFCYEQHFQSESITKSSLEYVFACQEFSSS